jgi:hypothetical protein
MIPVDEMIIETACLVFPMRPATGGRFLLYIFRLDGLDRNVVGLRSYAIIRTRVGSAGSIQCPYLSRGDLSYFEGIIVIASL